MRHAFTFALLSLFVALPAAAAGDGGGMVYRTFNFVLLFVVIFLLARKPIQAFFADRRSAIRKDLDDAAELKKQAEERYAQWQRRLVDLETELEGIRAATRERADVERENLLADARAAADRIRADAATAVDQEVRRAKQRLRDESSELAVELAAGILRERVSGDDRDRLLNEFIERIERSPEAGS